MSEDVNKTLLINLSNGVYVGVSAEDPAVFEDLDILVVDREDSAEDAVDLEYTSLNVPASDGTAEETITVNVAYAEIEESPYRISFIHEMMNTDEASDEPVDAEEDDAEDAA